MKDRFYPSAEPKFECCLPPFSFYQFIENFCQDQTSARTLHRIFSLMRKMNVQTVVTEKLERKGELDNEIKAVEKRFNAPLKNIEAWRFSFFTCPVTKEILPYVSDLNYLGYSVFIAIKPPDNSSINYIYEAVIHEPSFHNKKDIQSIFGESLPTHYVHCVRKYSAWVSDSRFTISGSFFSQQNGITNVCAHAALRWLLNNLPQRAESIVSCEDINKVLGIDHEKKIVDQGLRIEDLVNVIEKYKYNYILAKFDSTPPQTQPSYWEFIYSIIESGYPVLVFFTAENTRHVICAIGHTFNSDIWDAEARLAYSGAPKLEYISTSSWADHFIIHDDNYGMYFCMPRNSLRMTGRKSIPFRVIGALGIVPTVAELKPLEAELYSSVILGIFLEQNLKNCYWLETFKKEYLSTSKWIALRTFLANKTDYEKHLKEIEDSDGNFLKEEERQTIIGKLPAHFWITEFSLTDVYTANKHKLGEILYSSKIPKKFADTETEIGRAFSGYLAIRFPGNIIISKTTKKKEIEVDCYETDLTGHVSLMRTCEKSPFLEW